MVLFLQEFIMNFHTRTVLHLAIHRPLPFYSMIQIMFFPFNLISVLQCKILVPEKIFYFVFIIRNISYWKYAYCAEYLTLIFHSQPLISVYCSFTFDLHALSCHYAVHQQSEIKPAISITKHKKLVPCCLSR